MTFTRSFTAGPGDIDELGHVNNAVWVRWVQELAVAHWEAVATAEQQAAFVWVVTRHRIDYRGNLAVGEGVTGETWVPEPPYGARFDRHCRFLGADGRVRCAASRRRASSSASAASPRSRGRAVVGA